MRTLSRRMTLSAALVLPLAVANRDVAWAQAPRPSDPITGFSVVGRHSAAARVTAVDMARRTMTLALADGRTPTVKVGDSVPNLAQVRPGDNLVVALNERLSFVLSGPGATTPADRDIAMAARAAPGQRPAGVVGTQSISTWWVVGTDVPGNTISLVAPGGGQVRTFDVAAEGRSQLPRVKPGDKLTIIDSELLVIAITPSA